MRYVYYNYDQEQENFLKSLTGKKIINVKGLNPGSQNIYFYFDDKSNMTMFHEQDCCEYVAVDDIDGDESDLIDSTIITKGYVVIKWYGTSNGFYSEAVDIEYIDPNIKDEYNMYN